MGDRARQARPDASPLPQPSRTLRRSWGLAVVTQPVGGRAGMPASALVAPGGGLRLQTWSACTAGGLWAGCWGRLACSTQTQVTHLLASSLLCPSGWPPSTRLCPFSSVGFQDRPAGWQTQSVGPVPGLSTRAGRHPVGPQPVSWSRVPRARHQVSHPVLNGLTEGTGGSGPSSGHCTRAGGRCCPLLRAAAGVPGARSTTRSLSGAQPTADLKSQKPGHLGDWVLSTPGLGQAGPEDEWGDPPLCWGVQGGAFHGLQLEPLSSPGAGRAAHRGIGLAKQTACHSKSLPTVQGACPWTQHCPPAPGSRLRPGPGAPAHSAAKHDT